MNSKIARNLIVFAASLAVAAPTFLFAAPPTPIPGATNSPASSVTPANSANLDQRMQQMDNQLDTVFADTFRDFGNWFGPDNLGSSIDLRDQKDKYVVRVYVPGTDTSKVNARMEGRNTLRITAEGEKTSRSATSSERYEQLITLPGPVEASKMHIERKQNLVVIDLPKATTAMAAASPGISPWATPSGSSFAAFDRSIVDRMARMQGQMEQIFRNAFPDENLTNGFGNLNFGSAVHLDNDANQYVVHFYLPDKDLKNVNVQLQNDQLRLTASEKEQKQAKNGQSMESGSYEQLLTLPGPVKKKGMKVERQNGTIVVTLPKA